MKVVCLEIDCDTYTWFLVTSAHKQATSQPEQIVTHWSRYPPLN